MKKVLSVVLVLAMILGSFSMVFASNYSDVKDNDDQAEAINVLSGLDVIGGYADGTFRPEGVVTRAEMATMIVNALGIPVKGGAATKFSDVPASHWASGYINYAASVGFIAGYTDGTFQPEKQVSYNEAITMIVAALGYTADSLVGTYPGSFINKATSLGIMDNCKTTGTTGAVRGDIAQLLYDAMDCVIGYVDKDGAFHANAGKGENGYDTMFDRLGCEPYNNGKSFVVTGEEDSAINLKSYLGAYATAVQDKDGDIIAISEVSSIEISGYEKDGEVDGYKTSKAVIGANVIYQFVNGVYQSTSGAIDFSSDKTYSVKVSGNYITKVYAELDWTDKATFEMTEDLIDELKEDDTLNTYEFEMTNKDVIDTDEFVVVGADDLDAIKEGDIVTVYLSGVTTGAIVKVAVGTETVTGKITKINSDKDEFTIGGKVYEASSLTGAKSTSSLKAGDEIEAKLDYSGKIFTFDAVSSDSSYAVLLDKGEDTGRYSTKTVFVKLFLADGTEKELEVDEDIATAVASLSAVSKGDLVSYEVNSKSVVTTIAAISSVTTTGGINAKGLFDGAVVKDSTVIFSYNGDGVKAENYAVVKVASVLDTKPATAYGIVDDGVYEALLVSGISSADDELVIVTGYANVDEDGYKFEITALYDGAEKTFLCDADPKGYKTTTAAADLYKLTFDAKGNVASASIYSPTATAEPTDSAEKATVDGSIVTIGAEKFALEDDVVVYVFEDDEWTIGKASSIAAKAGENELVKFFDTDSTADTIYNVVLVFKM